MSVEDGFGWDDDGVTPRDPHGEDTGLRRQPCREWERVALQAYEAGMMLSDLILLGGTARAAV